MSQHFHLWVGRLYAAPFTVVVHHLFEQAGKALRQHLAYSDRRSLFMPLLVSFAVLGHDEISVLVYRQLWLAFVELHKGVVGVAEDTDGVSLQIADVLEQQLPSVLPKDVVLVLEQAVFDHLCLILAHQKLLDLVCIPHSHRL